MRQPTTRLGSRLADRIIAANQTLHQTPDTSAVPAGAGGDAGELIGPVRIVDFDRLVMTDMKQRIGKYLNFQA